MTEPKIFKSSNKNGTITVDEKSYPQKVLMFYVSNGRSELTFDLDLRTAEQFAQEILSKVEEVNNGRG